MLEFYFDMIICTFLMLYAWCFAPPEERGLFFATGDDIMCAVLTVLMTIAIVVFPFIMYFVTVRNFVPLEQDHGYLNKTKWTKLMDIIYEDLRLTSKGRMLFNLYFIMRRVVMVLVFIFMPDLPLFQCDILMVLSSLNMVYLVT